MIVGGGRIKHLSAMMGTWAQVDLREEIGSSLKGAGQEF